MATSSKPAKEICASCGKIGGENGFKLKKCSGCHLVNYCGIECQRAHRPSHKTTCQNHAIHQEAERVADVIRQHEKMNPPETEDCPICLQPIRVVDVNVRHFACCGNFACVDCCEVGASTGTLNSCPLCRSPPAMGIEVQKKLMKEHATEGRGWAQYNLGYNYRNGSNGFPWKPTAASKWYKLAAEQRFPDALEGLGMMYYHGEACITAPSYAKAFPLLREAADMGCTSAQAMMGVMYTFGQDSAIDLELAVKYFTLACKDDEDACYRLGNFYLKGEGGLKKSPILAKHYHDSLENFQSIHMKWESLAEEFYSESLS